MPSGSSALSSTRRRSTDTGRAWRISPSSRRCQWVARRRSSIRPCLFREHFGDYQRQLFLVDHAGLPLKTVLDQLDLLGEEVVPVLRKEIAARQDPQTPGGAHPRQPGPGQVRRSGTAPAAAERESRRQRDRRVSLHRHRRPVPGRVPGPVMPPPAQSGQRRVGGAAVRPHAVLMKQFAAEDIWDEVSMREYDVLYTLSKGPEPVRLSDLNRHVLLSHRLSRLVDRLAERGLVERCTPTPPTGVACGCRSPTPAGSCSAESGAGTPAAWPASGLTAAELAQLETICRKLAAAPMAATDTIEVLIP